MAYAKPEKWKDSSVKLFPYQVGFTAPPTLILRSAFRLFANGTEDCRCSRPYASRTDYAHKLDQRQKNFGLLEEFVECMANNGADVCAQVARTGCTQVAWCRGH